MSRTKNNNHNIFSSLIKGFKSTPIIFHRPFAKYHNQEYIWSDHTFLQRKIIYIVTIANPRMNKILKKYKNFSIQSP
jgi:hypothetical protein